MKSTVFITLREVPSNSHGIIYEYLHLSYRRGWGLSVLLIRTLFRKVNKTTREHLEEEQSSLRLASPDKGEPNEGNTSSELLLIPPFQRQPKTTQVPLADNYDSRNEMHLICMFESVLFLNIRILSFD